MSESDAADIKESLKWIRGRLEDGDERMKGICEILNGNGKLGLVSKVAILWHGQVWVVGAVGTVLGAALTKLFS